MRFFFPFLFLGAQLFADNGFISVQDLKTNIDNKAYILLDVSDYDTYKTGHIKNAVMVNIDEFRKKVGDHLEMKSSQAIQKIACSLGINENSKVVIYGHGNTKDLLKESYIATALIINGLNDVSILNGGYTAWTFDSNILSSTTISSNKDGNFTAHYNPSILVDINYVKEHLKDTKILDARSPEIYYGTELSNGVKRAGHISGAQSSYWKDKFFKDETVRNDDELLNMLSLSSTSKDERIISYCTSGMEASANWFILYKHFGFHNVKLYDASMREWGNREETPMKRYSWENFSK
jgi:thiosulfate/3-mercaptopyruvate sulfurtransferase